MLGLFCFHHFLGFLEMIVLRRVEAQSLALPDFVMLGMTVLRGVVAHKGPNNVRLGPKKVF